MEEDSDRDGGWGERVCMMGAETKGDGREGEGEQE